MRISRLGAVACLLVSLGAPAWAPAWAKDCNSDPNMNQSDLNACFGRNFAEADAAMNAKYKRILDCLKPTSPEGRPLVEAQRAWLTFRDLECRFQGGPSEGAGSAQPMVILGCREGLTRQRSKDLDYYLTCQEGDLCCPTFSCGFAAEKPKRP